MRRAESSGGTRAGWIEAGHLLGEGIGLVFTDRTGGVSPPPYDTLNLDYRRGDGAENVRANRHKVAAGLGIAAGRFVYLEQVHGLRVERAGEEDAGDGPEGRGFSFAATDGAFTTETGLALGVLTADCVPLALAAPQRGVVAMLHAGWRGTIGDIAAVALRRLAEVLGLHPGKVRAVMGPAIGPCCYRVDEGRARLFVERYGEESGVVSRKGGYRLDLLQANRMNLLAAGVREDNIGRVGGCTCCEARYFSFRREGVTGRQGAFVFLRQGSDG